MLNNISYKFRNIYFIRYKIIAAIVAVILMVSTIMCFPHFFRNTYRVTVTNKQIIKHNNIDRYFIYTQMENGKLKVFENTNNFLELKFNSKDLYWAIGIDRKYEIKAYGLNIPLLLSYQNITDVKAIE
jgi:hypothetical protein